MARRKHYRRTDKEAPELNITTFLNLMVVLVPFLLITAVFSRITILELNLPTGEGAASADKPQLSIEVVVREKGLEIGNGKSIIARIPKQDDAYDLKKLTEYLLEIKSKVPDKTDALVLMEPDIIWCSTWTLCAVPKFGRLTVWKYRKSHCFRIFP